MFLRYSKIGVLLPSRYIASATIIAASFGLHIVFWPFRDDLDNHLQTLHFTTLLALLVVVQSKELQGSRVVAQYIVYVSFLALLLAYFIVAYAQSGGPGVSLLHLPRAARVRAWLLRVLGGRHSSSEHADLLGTRVRVTGVFEGNVLDAADVELTYSRISSVLKRRMYDLTSRQLRFKCQ